MTSSKDLPPSTSSPLSVFIHNQFRAKPQWPPKNTDLSEKVAIVTGANKGLGFECSRQLLSYGLSHLIIAVRSTQKGESAASTLRKQYPRAHIEVWPLDMSSYPSIQEFAARVDSGLARLDIAVLNAGVMSFKYKKVPETGHEETMQVNYLSTMLLCVLLLPALKAKSPAGEPGRLTIVNTALSLQAPLPASKSSSSLSSFDGEKPYNGQNQYNMSKMLAHMFMYNLGDFVSADDVIVNLADPSFVKGTELTQGLPSIAVPLFKLFSALTGRTTEVGASTYVDAVVTKGKQSHCSFLMSWRIEAFNAHLYTPEGREVIDRTWQETMKELQFAGAAEILGSMHKA